MALKFAVYFLRDVHPPFKVNVVIRGLICTGTCAVAPPVR
jgi:hypothetical protein